MKLKSHAREKALLVTIEKPAINIFVLCQKGKQMPQEKRISLLTVQEQSKGR